MEFSPAFALLTKFTTGLLSEHPKADEILTVSKYLGVSVPDVNLDEQTAFLKKELSNQNRFLNHALDSDLIYNSPEYRKSMFVREIVANNRINREKDTAPKR